MITRIKTLLSPSKENEDNLLMEFRSLYQEHHQYVRNVIYWMVRSDDIDDLVQDTFVKAWSNLKNFNNESSFKTWIHRIGVNTAYDYLRKNKKPVLVTSYKKAREEDLSEKDLITKALMSLEFKYRELLVLSYKFEYTNKEIADIVGLKEGTVKSRLHTAKKEFKSFCLKEGVHFE